MNSNDKHEYMNGDNAGNSPKPIRKLVKVKNNQQQQQYMGSGYPQQQEVYRGQHEAPPKQMYQGQHETQPQQNYHGQHEAPPQQNYQGQHEAPSPAYYRGQHEAPPQYYQGKYEAPPQYYRGRHEAPPPMVMAYGNDRSKKGSWVDVVLKITAILVSLVIIVLLFLNMPIVWYKKNGQKERVSVITYFKRWQPLVEIEGELDKTQVDTKVDVEVVPEDFDDGLDLPQLVEGQYTVLFLGFDEEQCNTDVIWVCQFDIYGGRLNILQIPRDTCLPDYTSAANGKFNSIYQLGTHQELTPIMRVVNAIQENFNIPIDAYITTCCTDIQNMVDTVGGIPMDLDDTIMYEGDKTIEAGHPTILTGEQAEWFVRYRYGWLEGDIGRIKNQRRFMAAAMQKLLSIVSEEGKTKLYSYMKQIYDHKWIATDMSIEDLSKLSDFAATLSMDKVMVNMVPGEGTDNDHPYVSWDGVPYSIYSVHKQETIDMLNKYYRPYQTKLTPDEVTIVEYITEHTYSNYDDTGATLADVEGSSAPMKNPEIFGDF